VRYPLKRPQRAGKLFRMLTLRTHRFWVKCLPRHILPACTFLVGASVPPEQGRGCLGNEAGGSRALARVWCPRGLRVLERGEGAATRHGLARIAT
jgi:hypothetical protein